MHENDGCGHGCRIDLIHWARCVVFLLKTIPLFCAVLPPCVLTPELRADCLGLDLEMTQTVTRSLVSLVILVS